MDRRYFTSESVTEGHPDKLCDQVSDAVVDEILRHDPAARVACECTASTGLLNIFGEITTSCYVDLQKVARDTVRDIGYTRGKYGFDADTCAVVVSVLLSAGFTPAPRFHYFSLRRSLQNVKTFPLPDFHNSNNSASAICKTALRAYRG